MLDLKDDLLLKDDDWQYCDDCLYLNPDERSQTRKKEEHFCLLFKKQVKHSGMHPHIRRIRECIETCSKTVRIKEGKAE